MTMSVIYIYHTYSIRLDMFPNQAPGYIIAQVGKTSKATMVQGYSVHPALTIASAIERLVQFPLTPIFMWTTF